VPDMAAITAALTGLKAAADIARALRDAQTAFDRADLKLRIAELVDALAETKLSLAEIQEALATKDAEIKRLMDALKLKAQLVRHNDAYYEKDGDGRPVGAPYCSACLETRHQAVHIHQNPAERRQSICPACKSVFHWQRRDPVASQDA